MKKNEPFRESFYRSLKKTLQIMRFATFLLILGILQVNGVDVYSQKARLTVDFVDTELIKILDSVEEESEFFFLYNEKLLDLNRKVNINAVNQPIDVILDELFVSTDVKYSIIDRKIILAPEYLTEEALLQQVQISGTITDASTGEPMTGVNIQVKGTNLGAISDINGRYSIPSTVEPDAVLRFSFIGYQEQEVSIDGRSIINVSLVEELKALEEVVVIGYGSVKKSDVTGSVTSLSDDNLSRGVVSSPHQAMQGKVSGVNVTLNSGEPGANSNVLIRGGTSITASNSPLYVIDGVPVAFDEGSFSATSARQTRSANNPLNMINPSDILSIDILKDASATAIYGSRGANGVIMISTKQGAAGLNKISYDSYVGISKIRKKLDILTADEFRSYISSHPEITGWVDGGADTDWQEEIYRTAISNSHSIALSSGGKQTNYRASVTYSDQQGIILKSDLQRIIGRVNVNHKVLNDRIDIKLFLSGASLKNHTGANPESTGSQYDGGIIRDALGMDPTYPVKDSNGKYTFRGVLNLNPVEQASTLIDITETFRNLGNIMVDFKLTDFLTFSTNAGFTKEYVNRYFYAPILSQVGSNSHGQGSQQTRNNYSNLLETNLLFKKVIGGNHDINAIVGYSFQEYFYTSSYIVASNFITDANTYNNLGAGVTQNPVSTGKSSNRLISFFGRATYSYSNKYLLTATVRQDGSSRFGANNKWGTFPSVAVAWKITEEPFLKDNKVLSNLKLRIGYGITGNQAIGNYRSLSTLSAGGNLYIIGGKVYTAVGADQNYNPDLKWESTSQLNIGLDFGFLDDRIYGTFDYYNKQTKDLLLSFTVPSPAEVSSIMANVGGVENKGIEFELNAIVLSKNQLQGELYGNLSYNNQKVTSLSNETWSTEAIYSGGVRAAGYSGFTCQIIQPGSPIGTFYGYKYLGVDENGRQKFEDLDMDGQILPGTDRTIIGSYRPDLLYGIGTKINYKSFSFDCFFRGVAGAEILNSTALELQNKTRIPAFNVSQEALTDGLAYGVSNVFSSQWIQNASFLRLDNATLGYNVNLNSAIFSKLYLYITGQNLFVLTKYIGYDPEVNDGIDYMNYPNPRNFVLGLSVEF